MTEKEADNEFGSGIKVKIRLILLTIVGFAISGCEAQRDTPTSSTTLSITLSIDFQGRTENLNLTQKIPSGQTVWDLMNAAKSNKALDFKHRGESETAFIYQINGIKNEMANGANWLFFVNGEMARQGAGETKLTVGDTVLWKFSAEYLD